MESTFIFVSLAFGRRYYVSAIKNKCIYFVLRSTFRIFGLWPKILSLDKKQIKTSFICICSRLCVSLQIVLKIEELFWEVVNMETSPNLLSTWAGFGFNCCCACGKSLQSCLTLCNPMGGSLPGSSVHGVLCHGLPCPLPGIFLTQGLNSCLLRHLHWQAGSLSLAPPGKP